MQLATMSSILGGIIYAALASLIPAFQPFYSPAELVDESAVVGTFAPLRPAADGKAAPSAEKLVVLRAGPHAYRLSFSVAGRSTEFDGRLFRLKTPAGTVPRYFFDLTPRSLKDPARSDFRYPKSVRHLALEVGWSNGELRLGTFKHEKFEQVLLTSKVPHEKSPDYKLDPNYRPDCRGFPFAEYILSGATADLHEFIATDLPKVSSEMRTLYRQ